MNKIIQLNLKKNNNKDKFTEYISTGEEKRWSKNYQRLERQLRQRIWDVRTEEISMKIRNKQIQKDEN